MTITAIASVSADADEYSRYSAAGRATIGATVAATGNDGDIVYLSLRDQRTDRAIASTQATLASGSASASIDLHTDTVDADGINRAVHGQYVLRARNAPEGEIASASADSTAVRIAIVAASDLRAERLFGIDPRDQTRLAISVQGIPGIVGGETRDLERGGYPLRLERMNRTLSWHNGPAVALTNAATQTVDLWNATLDGRITLTVTLASLPSVTGTITYADGYTMLDYPTLDDATLARVISDAYAQANTYLGSTTLEPETVCTARLASRYPWAARRDIAAQPWRNPTSQARGPRIVLPRRRVIALHTLEGWHNQTKVLEVRRDWRVVDSFVGECSFVPSASAQYPAASPLLGMYYGITGQPGLADHIAEYWQYAFTSGLPDLHDSVGMLAREWVARRAAITILLRAGRALQGAYAAESFGRDGVSLSRQYTSGQMGVYSAEVADHQAWLDRQGPILRRQIVGIPASN